MAGGKQSPRQKMVNLMYLIFIAMLALNMSKEVLAAFGLMNEKMETSNVKTTESNDAFLASLGTKAEENAAKYDKLHTTAQEIKSLSQGYFDYIQSLKTGMTKGLEDPKNYTRMDNSDYLDQKFFQGDNLTEGGKEFMKNLTTYRDEVAAIVPAALKQSVIDRFQTGNENGKVKAKDGMQDWINYHYEGYPLVASLAKLTALQSDIKVTEENALKAMLAGELTDQVSLKNFATSLKASKSAFYSGEKYDGKIIISKTDNSSTPVRADLTLDGRKLAEGKDYKLEAGGIKMLIGAGRPGDHAIVGNMYFKQDGEEIEVPVKNSFATISKPNAALIAADKMNVVYRGVSNPMSISIPGIADNKVNANATGLKRRQGSSYSMNPGKGREVTITASGTTSEGTKVGPFRTKFRIKDIPRPSGTIRGQAGAAKMSRSGLEKSTIGAVLEDFDFDLKLKVSGFKFKVPGQPTVIVKGGKLDSRAKSALKRAKRGDAVQIFDVEAFITNNKTYKLKKVSPVVVEITN